MALAVRNPVSAITGAVRVMLCDDSAVIRSILGRVLATDGRTFRRRPCLNGRDALEQLRSNPDLADVLILDIEMPEMDGLTALPLLLKVAPGLKVVIASTLSTRGAATTLEALRLGAVDYIPKPSAALLSGDTDFQRELLAKIHGLGRRQGARPVGSQLLAASAASLHSTAAIGDRQFDRRPAGADDLAAGAFGSARPGRVAGSGHLDPAHAAQFHAVAG